MVAPLAAGAGTSAPPSFGRSLPVVALSVPTRTTGIDWFEQTIVVGTLDMSAAGLGGWTLDPHHAFDPEDAGALYLGDGTVLDGHHRIVVLRERDVSVDALPREVLPQEPKD